MLINLYAESYKNKVEVDEYSIKSIFQLPEISDQIVLAWAADLEKNQNVSTRDLLPFCDKSKFFQNLSPELQRKEAFLSLPFRGFKKWLAECLFEDF